MYPFCFNDSSNSYVVSSLNTEVFVEGFARSVAIVTYAVTIVIKVTNITNIANLSE